MGHIFLHLVGLSPVWGMTLVLVLSRAPGQGEYWSGAGWLVLFAVPFCALAYLIAAATLRVFRRTDGVLPRLGAALATLVGGFAAAFVALYAFFQWAGPRRADPGEEHAVLAFARSHPAVLEAAGGAPRVSVWSMRGEPPKVSRYELVVEGPASKRYAYVGVERAWRQPPRFHLQCVVPRSEGQVDTSIDVCRQ